MDEQPEGRRARILPAVIWGIVLFLVCGLAFYIRVHFAHDVVFSGGSVWFQGADPWYHMRLVENLVQHFPHRIYFDAYSYYPHGCTIPWPPFYDWLIALGALIVGLGHPSAHTVETVGAYTPAILGALTVIPVYFIGKELFSRLAGIFSAILVAILPTEFMNRSMLGFTDHHVAEALFSATAIMFLIMAVKRFRERGVALSHLINRDWAVIKKPLIYAVLAGIFLGIYLLTWIGGLMVIFIIFVFLVIQFVIDHLRGTSTDYLCIAGVVVFVVASIIRAPLPMETTTGSIYPPTMTITILTPLGLNFLSRYMTRRAWNPLYYPLAVLGIAGIAFLLFWVINPELFHTMVSRFGVFAPRATGRTVAEVIPLDMPLAWNNFNTAFFISFISFFLLIYRAAKEKSAGITLFLVWCAVMLVAMLGQRRFCYYFTVNVALLAGYFSWRIIDLAGLKKLMARAKPKEAVTTYTTRKKKKRAKAEVRVSKKGWLQPRGTWIRVIIAGIVIFFLVFFPNIDPNDVATRIFYPRAYQQNLPAFGRTELCASGGTTRVPSDWYGALMWLRNNTTEPFGDPDFYYQLYQAPPRGEDYDYPDTAYGIMSWWDYGHWITRIGRRIPIANPFQQAAPVAARYLTAQNETAANPVMDEVGADYVVIDYAMLQWPVYRQENFRGFNGKFHAMVTWAGKKQSEFYEVGYVDIGGGTVMPIPLYHPAFYNCTVVRLFNFNGQEVIPTGNATEVISYQEWEGDGVTYKGITRRWSFSTYEEAKDFIASQPSGNYQIVGTDPLKSPVPLAKMEHYQLVYDAPGHSVKIFEYIE